MTYFEGFVTPVPTANRDAYLKHAREASEVFKEIGMTRMVEAWGDDIPEGKLTDFRRAVDAKDDESVLFSWFEYPDKATRDAATKKMMDDPRMEAMAKDMPFDGKRMIYGGFDSIVDDGGERGGYVDGFIVPVPEGNKDAYLALATKASADFKKHGANRLVEAWGDDVPEGKVTDYRRAVKAEAGETVVFSFLEWPDKATRDAGWKAMMADPEMKPGENDPFDGKRMFWGGFTPILDTAGE